MGKIPSCQLHESSTCVQLPICITIGGSPIGSLSPVSISLGVTTVTRDLLISQSNSYLSFHILFHSVNTRQVGMLDAKDTIRS